jgi:type I restriction enzyme S subunit
VKFKQETDFQETEIGKIPREWKIERLGHIVKYVKGKKPSALFDERPSEEYVPYLTAEYMRGLDKPKWCNPKLENNIIEVFHDDVIMIWDGSYAGHVFTGFNGILASTMVKIIPVVKLDKKFLYYYLLANFEEFRSTTVGTGVPHVNKKVFEEFPTPVPPIHEQRGIAGILSIVDRVIEAVDAGVARLEGLKKALMRELLTGRIRVREENGKLVFNKETDFQETEIGKIPREWRVKKLGELVFEIYYGLTAKAVDQPTELRMLRTTDIKDNYRVDWDSLPYCEITDNRRSNIQKYLLRKNDLVVSRAGTTGMSILVDKDLNDVIFGSYLIKIKLNESVAYPKFIHYFMQSSLYWNQLLPKQAGSTLKNISLPILKNILTPLPPINEQKLIPEILSTLDRAIELYREERTRLDRLKRGLMDLLLTGKIRVVED